MNPIECAAREMVLSDISCAEGYRRANSLAGAVLAIQYQVPRQVAEVAVRAHPWHHGFSSSIGPALPLDS
jgi:hypothetical protein